MILRCSLGLALLLSSFALAADVDCLSAYKEREDLFQKYNQKPKPADYAAQTKKANDRVEKCERERTASLADCGKVKQSFIDIVKKAQEDCKGFKLESSADPGSIACSAAVDKCLCADKTVAAERTKAGSMCFGVKDEDLSHCPTKSEERNARLDRKATELEARADKLKEKIGQLEGEADKADNNINDKMQQSKQTLRRAEADHAQAMNEAASSLSAAQASVAQQLNGLRDKIYTAQQSVVDAALKDSAAFTAWQEQDLKIELNCTSQANQAISAMQSEAIAALKSGAYNRGNQADIFRQVGLTDRQSWQKQAAVRKRWCMDSEMTHGSKTSNQRAYNETLKGNAAAKKFAQDQVANLNQQMSQLQNPDNSCGTSTANGAATVTQACRDIAESRRKTAAADQALDRARKDAEDEKVAAAAAQNKSARKNDSALAKAKSDLIEVQARADKAREAADASDTYERAGAKAPEARAMNIDFEKLTDKAGQLNRCCKLSSGASPGQPANRDFATDDNCGSAEKYLQARGFNTDLNLASSRRTSPAAPASTPRPSSTQAPSGSTTTETPSGAQ